MVFLIATLILISVSLGSTSLESDDFAEVEDDDLEAPSLSNLTAGQESVLVREFNSNSPHAQEMLVEIELLSETDYEEYDDIFDVSLSLESETEGFQSISSCSFEGDGSWLYNCPRDSGDVFEIEPESEGNNLTVSLEPPINMQETDLTFNSNVKAREGEFREIRQVNTEESDTVIVDEFEFALTGLEMEGEIAEYEDFVFDSPTDLETLGRFGLSLDEVDTAVAGYMLSEDLVQNYNYDLELYELEEGEWSLIDEDELVVENRELIVEVDPDKFYSLHVDREELTIDERIDIEPEFTTEFHSNDTLAETTVENLGETEEIEMEAPTLNRENNQVNLTRIDFTSNINNTLTIETSSHDQLPENTTQTRQYFQPETYTEIQPQQNNSITLDNLQKTIKNNYFDFEENIATYKYNETGWHQLTTEIEEENEDNTVFTAQNTGNSLFAKGKHQSDIEINQTQATSQMLNNETYTLEATLKNHGIGTGEKELEFQVDQEQNKTQTETVTVPGESNETITFTEENFEPGNYTVQLNDESHSLEVKQREIPVTERLSIIDIVAYGVGGLTAFIFLVFAAARIKKNGIPLDMEKMKESQNNEESSEEEKVYRCETCQRTFQTQEMLDEHNEKLHEKENEDGEYTCDHCSKSFDTEAGLEVHLEEFHKNE